jgi:hypothetical protein
MPDNLTSGTLNKAGRIVRKSGNDYGINLADWARLWPTPRAFMHKDSATDRGKSNLGEVVGGQLNPMWVEWLMGFPLGWTDLEDSETQ